MSVQHKISVMRPPRVQITYDVETCGSLERKELPFIVGIISDLAGETILAPLTERRFTVIDGDNFDDILAFISPTLNLNINGEQIKFEFKQFTDFLPDSVILCSPSLKKLLAQRVALTDLAGKLDGNIPLENALIQLTNSSGDVNEIKTLLNTSDSHATSMLEAFATAITGAANLNNVYQFLVDAILQLDASLSTGLDKILHNAKFQQLSSAWFGLRYLVSKTLSSERLKLRVLCASKSELQADLDKSPSFDHSNLFKKVYEEEYGTPGGKPYSCLVLDEYFSRTNADLEYARKLTEVACAAHAPLITSAHPNMFGLNSFKELARINDIGKIFEGSEAAKFNSLREASDSCYVAFAMPRILMRSPYHHINNPIKSFRYEETINSDADLSWGNAAYAIGGSIVEAYAYYGWTAAIRGVEGGGLLENLPQYTFKTEQGDVVLQCPTEIAITDRKERELSNLGFLPVCHIKGTCQAVIFGAQTAQKAKLYVAKEATANASISTRLPYILNCSRFAHYIKVMMRDKIGSAMSASDVERFLQNWLGDYVLLTPNAPLETKARIPLQEGVVQVVDDEERPGSYRAIVYLRPHFQMEDLTVSIRLVAKIPQLTA